MSDREMWRDRVTYFRRESTGVDPVTRRPIFDKLKILDNEPCDLSYPSRRVGQQGPSGMVYNVIKSPRLKVQPIQGFAAVPDENDTVIVNNEPYRVESVETSRDGADGRYMGSRLSLTRSAPVEPRQAGNP